MITLQSLLDTKQITKTEFLAGKLYHQIRCHVLRSKEIHNVLHESSTYKLIKTKGRTIDAYASPQLEHFWDQLEIYFQLDHQKPLAVLDYITGLKDAGIKITVPGIKDALKKINKIFRNTDVVNLMNAA
ncbi:MAG: hypothetical protein Q8K36_04360 [Alphaproteobacteria bacterium]|nr:hypothetical protein [Alphaproteobacteria bacterium]